MSADPLTREIVSCTVVTHLPFGLLVDLENNEKGVIRIRETFWDAKERANWKDRFAPGARLKAVILKRPEGKYVELSARLAQEDPWEHIQELFHEGQVVCGVVTGVKHYGAFVEIQAGLTGLLHQSRLPAWCKGKPLDLFWPGDLVKVQIARIDPKQRQISLASAPITYNEPATVPIPVSLPVPRVAPNLPFDLLVRENGRRYILLIEDDPETGRAIESWLSNLGQRVRWAVSAEEGLEFLEKEQPDLVIADLMLPGMSGMDLIRTIQARWPLVHCVLNSSLPNLEQYQSEMESLQQAGVDILSKPLLPDDLLDLLMRVENQKKKALAAVRSDAEEARLPDVYRSTLQSGFRKLMQSCLEVTDFSLGVLFRLDPVHRKIDIMYQTGDLPGVQPYLDDLIFSPVRDVAEDGDLVRVEDIEAGNYDARFKYLLKAYPFAACVGVCIPNKLTQNYGLFLFDQTAREIYDEEVAFAQATALAVGSLLERRLLADQLRASQKMTMLGHLSSYLSHELNHGISPLNNSIENLAYDLNSLSGLLKQSPDKLEQELVHTQEHLRDLRRSVDNLNNTIRAFRDLLSVGNKQIVNMDELVRETLSLLKQTSAVSRVRLKFQPGESLMAIRSQMHLLQHVLLNLLINAIEQIAESRPMEGGQVQIRVEKILQPNTPAVIRILVEDNGPGIHWRLWDKIFEAGFTTRKDGSGLGLYISRNIVESLGGRIYVVESYINGGTIFAVDLPYQI